VDVKHFAVAAGLACACTVADPSYISPTEASTESSSAGEAGSSGAGGDENDSQAEDATTNTGDASSSGDAETSESTASEGSDATASTEGEAGDGDGDGDQPFEETSRDCGDAQAGVGMQEVQAVFDTHCVECHSPPMTPLGLDLTPASAWTSLVNVTAGNCNKIRIIPDQPAASYLLDKLEDIDLCGGQQMPRNAPPLSLEERNAIQSWICAGAPQ
jgi:hypothetical protein